MTAKVAATVGVHEVQGQLLAAIKTMSNRAEAYARDKDPERARIYSQSVRDLAEAWAALTRD